MNPHGHHEKRASGAVLVLAAGHSVRFGEDSKQLALLDGRPLVRHPVEAALRAGIGPVLVVTGHDAPSVADALPQDTRLHLVHNPEFESGQSSSVRAGIEALPTDVEFVIVLLGDQPGIAPRSLLAVSAAIREGARVARARYEDGPSHPIAFHREVWPSLLQLDGDRGARDLLDALGVTEVMVEGRRPADVDTRDDLDGLRRRAEKDGTTTCTPG